MRRCVGMQASGNATKKAMMLAAEGEEGEALLPSLDTFTEEDQAKVTKIQAAARGKIARKEVAAKKKSTAAEVRNAFSCFSPS
jgi:hypothetical protein